MSEKETETLAPSAEFVGAMFLAGHLYRTNSFTDDQCKIIDQCLASMYVIENGKPCNNDTMTTLAQSEQFCQYGEKVKALIDQRAEEGVLRKRNM